jgi:signal transduction histidine kinase
VLRSETPGTAPTPGLADLDGLLESARTGGVRVSCEITGAPRTLPGGVDLSAYRIVQEALSNAIRHAPGSRVQVGLYYGEAALVIEVRNPGAAAALERDEDVLGRDVLGRDVLGRGGGHGIIGMRERAAMLGGHLSAGPTIHDEFLVTAALPLDGGDQELAPRSAVMEEPT